VHVADPKEKLPMSRFLADAVFHPTSCEYYNLCIRFKALLGLPGQPLHYAFDNPGLHI